MSKKQDTVFYNKDFVATKAVSEVATVDSTKISIASSNDDVKKGKAENLQKRVGTYFKKLKIEIMNKTKIFMALGSVVLASAAFVAAKPAKKVLSATTVWAALPSTIVTLVSGGGNFTASPNGHTLAVKTGANTYAAATNSSGIGSAVYLK